MRQSFLTHAVPFVAAALLLSVGSGCHPEAPPLAPGLATVAPALGPMLSQDHDGGLYFDERYLDSTDTEPKSSWSARSQREMAIFMQLKRLRLAKRGVADAGAAAGKDSVWERVGDGPLVGYRNETAAFADIYRKIDSLKVLEHIPLTPH